MRTQNIKTVSYIHTGEGLTETENLPENEKKRFSTQLKKSYFNSMFQGRAVFRESGEISQKMS